MTIARIIRAADCPEVPWKNGGGTTREIAVCPPGAGMGDFLWRLSMARVEQAGPFSSFDGIDRTLAVLEGTLHLSGAVDAVLDPVSAPFPFDGAANVEGVPLGGAVLDLNAMVRRGTYNCEMQRLPPAQWSPPQARRSSLHSKRKHSTTPISAISTVPGSTLRSPPQAQCCWSASSPEKIYASTEGIFRAVSLSWQTGNPNA
ncbi:HutD family protein [Novosphingobium resinovorum]